ncbi:YesK family protein [Gottfriedia acidiceleris]|uniref:YesK family protein n=1 Tax=Gottfriedia acidiceleris TaxID=371036 RepID=UPI003D230E7F
MLPFILIGIVVAAVIFVLGLFTNKKRLYVVSFFISIISVIIVVFSIFGVGGWTGMGLGAFSISTFLGSVIGIILMTLIPINNDSITK